MWVRFLPGGTVTVKKTTYSGSLMGTMFRKLARKVGARVLIEPTWNTVGQIVYQSGRKRYFRYSSLDLNTLGASEIAKDKDYANFFMKRMGYRTIVGKAFYSSRWAKAIGSHRDIDAAYRYAQTIGFPVIVKPNSGSQGVGVELVHTKREFYTALRRIFKGDRIALVQQQVLGRDYRLVVLDDKMISAYQRSPLKVIGDGKSNIKRLLKIKQRDFLNSGRDTLLRIDDPRIKAKLKRQGLSFNSIPTKNQKIPLLDNANLSGGGDAIDVTSILHPAFKNLAIKLTRDMGLRLCGVDFMIDGDCTKPPSKSNNYWILEINAAPGLDHYVKTGNTQRKIVEDMYLEVLRHMEHD
ncbi:MAG: cyanophycin synthetase [Candidatus Pacebacteria bacterium]|nr:cyanophycin synthetase [Candidatus Paceibacterota bacterium]